VAPLRCRNVPNSARGIAAASTTSAHFPQRSSPGAASAAAPCRHRTSPSLASPYLHFVTSARGCSAGRRPQRPGPSRSARAGPPVSRPCDCGSALSTQSLGPGPLVLVRSDSAHATVERQLPWHMGMSSGLKASQARWSRAGSAHDRKPLSSAWYSMPRWSSCRFAYSWPLSQTRTLNGGDEENLMKQRPKSPSAMLVRRLLVSASAALLTALRQRYGSVARVPNRLSSASRALDPRSLSWTSSACSPLRLDAPANAKAPSSPRSLPARSSRLR